MYDPGLGESPGIGLAAVQYIDYRLLRGGGTGSDGQPEIFNTDQGCQFTSQEFTEVLKDPGIQTSMDGTRRWRDNVFVERLWRSLNHEEVYLHSYETVHDAQEGGGAT